MKNYKATISFLAISSSLMFPTAAFAQSASKDQAVEPSDEGLGAIVVTARKREENLQQVPVAVTVISGEKLTEMSVHTLLDATASAPNVRIRTGGGNQAALIYLIRGQVSPEIIATQDATVGIYVDGLIWGRAIGANSAALDIAAVEVLKGPQGTLFGRNTTGGAVNIRTNDPTIDQFEGSVTAGAGNYGRAEGSLVLNVPLGEKAAIRFAGKHYEDNGQFYNPIRNERAYFQNTESARVKLLLEPTETIRAVFTYEYFDAKNAPLPYQLAFYNPNTSARFQVAAEQTKFGPVAGIVRNDANSEQFFGEAANFSDSRTHTAMGTIAFDLGAVELKAIGGYRKVSHHTPTDIDATPYKLISTDGAQKMEQYSLELQAVGKAFNDRLEYVIGAFGFKESGFDTSTSFALVNINPSNPAFVYGDVKNTSKAIYTQNTLRITDQLSFTGGLRYSTETKKLGARNSNGGVCVVPVADRVSPAVCQSAYSRTDDGWSYTAGFDYKITPDVMVYTKTSRAFRSGGQNLRGVDAISFKSFAPERITDYEVGFKSQFLDNRVRLNVAAFYSDGKDLQRNTLAAATLPNGTITTRTLTTNAASGSFKGGEAEIEIQAARGLRISGSAGLTIPKYKEFKDIVLVGGVPTIIDRSAEPFNFISKWTLNGAVDYSTATSMGELKLHADVYHTTKQSFTEGKDPLYTFQKPYTLVAARASISPVENIDVAVYCRNCFNEKYDTNALNLSSSLGVIVRSPGERRTYGVEATYRF